MFILYCLGGNLDYVTTYRCLQETRKWTRPSSGLKDWSEMRIATAKESPPKPAEGTSPGIDGIEMARETGASKELVKRGRLSGPLNVRANLKYRASSYPHPINIF